MNRNIFRFIRGAVGNAIVWGATWSAAVFVVAGVVALLGRGFSWDDTWRLAARLSVVGGITGGAFSTFIGLAYRGRRLSEISWVKFGLGGGVLAGLFVPSFMFVARAIAGDGPLAMQNYVASGLMAAVFGGVAAAASIKLAQRASKQMSGASYSEPELLTEADPFASSTVRDADKQKVYDRPNDQR